MPTAATRPSVGPLLAFVAASVLLVGCALGERPTLVDEQPIENSSIRSVLDRLQRAESGTFTATYDIFTKFGGAETTAAVVQDSGRREITVGEVVFRIGDTISTCVADNCSDTLDDARLSDIQVTHQFWGDSARNRLETDATRNIGDPEGTVVTVAGQPAACVDVPVAGGTKQYCALDAGPLARYDGADVTIELTSFSAAATDLDF